MEKIGRVYNLLGEKENITGFFFFFFGDFLEDGVFNSSNLIFVMGEREREKNKKKERKKEKKRF